MFSFLFIKINGFAWIFSLQKKSCSGTFRCQSAFSETTPLICQWDCQTCLIYTPRSGEKTGRFFPYM
ncbi:hypothetical protein XELAEV_18008438mg [Xenopus laevis]|uniref:Uncharacterized protein n=1 Tax=Xenopus laevis TaxID=8355 RepID=A0A974E438_XENLA|nr:hypothetical protein XELAEV_18008438mg [Xenopus laevis]